MNLTKEDLQAIRTLIREETQPGFQEIDKRFKVVDKSLASIHGETSKRFEMVNKRLEEAKMRFGTIDKKLEEINKRFDVVDEGIETIVQELVKFTGELHQDHDDRIGRLEQHIHTHT